MRRRYAFIALFASVAVAVAVAVAGDITFQWDHDQQPTGVTFELEANGVTASGITGLQHTLDVPGDAGDPLTAKVRTIAPPGYECGDPLGPCPPSDWATLTAVIPEPPTQPNDPAGVLVSKVLMTLSDFLVAEYRLDSGTGTIAVDSSGNGNDGTISGATWVTGKYDQALSFDGVDDRVELGVIDVPVNTSELTLAAWVNPASFATMDARIISKANGVNELNHWWMLSTISSGSEYRLRFRLKADGITSTLIASSGALSLNTWTHVAAVYDGQNMILYKDGAEVGRLAKGGTVDVDVAIPAWIGANPDSSRFFDGLIDEVKIYPKSLNQSEIQDIM